MGDWRVERCPLNSVPETFTSAPQPMNQNLRLLVETEARAKGLMVDPSFYARADNYIDKHFRNRTLQETIIVESYLAQAAIRIAKSEGKARLEGEDFKAAVWLFHQPDQPDDPCVRAGEAALLQESKRLVKSRGLLLEAFAKRLDADLHN